MRPTLLAWGCDQDGTDGNSDADSTTPADGDDGDDSDAGRDDNPPQTPDRNPPDAEETGAEVACPFCTFLNPPTASHCRMCFSPGL